MTGETKVAFEATAVQKKALSKRCYEILFGGARGGGKTSAGIAWFLYDISNSLFRGLVIRKNADDLLDWIQRAKELYSNFGAKFAGKPPIITFPSGATIRTGHLKDENAFTKYQGHEYHRILIEELTQIPSERQYMMLISSARSTVEGLKAQIFATTNPGGAGHKWVKKRFIDVTEQGTKFKDPISGRERIFISAKVDDNPHLMKKDPDYVKFLDSLPAGLREAWRHGSWDDVEVEGAYYGKLIQEAYTKKRIIMLPYEKGFPVYTVWDLGISDTMVVGFFQKVNEQLRIIDVYANNNEGLDHYSKVIQNKPYFYGKHFAPHDIQQRDLITGQTRLQRAKEYGLHFLVVPKLNIIDGIDKVRLAFNHIYIDETLVEFIDALKNYRKKWNENLQIFENKPLHDWTSHYADMLRYAVMVENEMVMVKRRIQRKVNRNRFKLAGVC